MSFYRAAWVKPLPEEAVRAAILLRANALARGFSAVRLVVIERLLDLLNHRITPVVPRFGSVGRVAICALRHTLHA